MTNAELLAKIKAEIERRKKEIHATVFNDEFDSILSFLSTLESENPMNQEGFEEEINKAMKSDLCPEDISDYDFCCIARHFYEIGCHRTAEKYDEIEYNRQKAEESVPKDLEEAAESHAKTKYGLTRLLGAEMKEVEDDFITGARWQENKDQETIKLAEDHAFLAGADWQKEHTPLPEDTVLFNKGVEEGKRLMMEEAVGAEYGYFSNASKTILPSGKLNIKEGDKVRIIIVKEN